MLIWPSIGFYCLFSVFVFYQQLHGKNFRGSSQAFGLALNIFAFAGMLTGFAYLIYYGWTIVWWAPLVVFGIGLIASILGVVMERILGSLVLSLAGFVAWPVSAYFMFALLP